MFYSFHLYVTARLFTINICDAEMLTNYWLITFPHNSRNFARTHFKLTYITLSQHLKRRIAFFSYLLCLTSVFNLPNISTHCLSVYARLDISVYCSLCPVIKFQFSYHQVSPKHNILHLCQRNTGKGYWLLNFYMKSTMILKCSAQHRISVILKLQIYGASPKRILNI